MSIDARRVIEALLFEARASGIDIRKPPLGPHLAIKSTSEGRGYCNAYALEMANRCGPRCLKWQAAIALGEQWLAENPEPKQISFLEVSA